MLQLDKKNWIFLVLILLSGLVLKFILPDDFDRLNKLGIYFSFLLLLIFFFFRKQKVLFSLKLKSNIQHKWFALLVLILLLIYAFFSVDFPISDTLKIHMIIYVIIIAYIQSLTEEIIFRGVFFNNYLVNNGSLKKAVFYSSVLFGLIHLMSIGKTDDMFAVANQVIIAAFIGVFFCGLFIYFRNIYFMGVFHMLVNIPAYFNRIANTEEATQAISETPFLENLISSVLMVILFSPVLIIGLVLVHKAKTKELPEAKQELLFS